MNCSELWKNQVLVQTQQGASDLKLVQTQEGDSDLVLISGSCLSLPAL